MTPLGDTKNWRTDQCPTPVSGYQYVLELRRKEGQQDHLGTFAVKPDWEPALEWARFSAICRDPSPPFVLSPDSGTIEPRWDARVGMPYLEGVKATLPRDGLPPAAFDIPLSYFASLASTASSALVKAGKLTEGELFQYLVCAYACQHQPATPSPEGPTRWAIKPLGQVLDVSDLDMDELLADSSPCGSDTDEPMPVFMPSRGDRGGRRADGAGGRQGNRRDPDRTSAIATPAGGNSFWR